MSVWHGDLHKRKPSGSKKRQHRKKRDFETGSFPTETMLGEPERKVSRRLGGTVKVRVRRERYACISNQETGETKRVEILRVIRNPANVDYNRRGIITKGVLIETKLGTARVTSRPGQDGVINAVLTSK